MDGGTNGHPHLKFLLKEREKNVDVVYITPLNENLLCVTAVAGKERERERETDRQTDRD